MRRLQRAGIGQCAGLDRQGIAQQLAARLVVQLQLAPGSTQPQRTRRLHGAAVAQTGALYIEIAAAEQLPGVLQLPGRFQAQATLRLHLAGAAQAAGFRCQLCTGPGAQCRRAQVHITAAAQIKTAAGIQARAAGPHLQAAETQGRCAASPPGGTVHRRIAADTQAQVTGGEATLARGAVQQAGSAHAKVALGGQLASVQADTTDARIESDIALGAEFGVAAIELQSAAIDLAAGVLHRQVLRGANPPVQLDPSGSAQGEVTGAGRLAAHAHANAIFGREQADAVGVHAAQRRGVDGVGRFVAVRRQGVDGAIGIIEAVAAGDDADILAVHLAIDQHVARHQVEHVLALAIQALAGDQDIATVDLEAAHRTVRAQHRLASGESRAVTVDETTAGAGDAVWVGNDHVGLAAEHFGVALQARTIIRHHLVEDDPRLIVQVEVRHHLACQLRLQGSRARLRRVVVEHLAAGVDVVLDVAVVRDTGGIAGSDVDDLHTVAGSVGLSVAIGSLHPAGQRRLRVERGGQAAQHEHPDLPARPCAPRTGRAALTLGAGVLRGDDEGVAAQTPDHSIDVVHDGCFLRNSGWR